MLTFHPTDLMDFDPLVRSWPIFCKSQLLEYSTKLVKITVHKENQRTETPLILWFS
jgi:hypothetical protein